MSDDTDQNGDETSNTAIATRQPTEAQLAARFKRGQSGNPGGRSKLDKIVRQFVGKNLEDMLRVQQAIALGQSSVVLADGTKLDLPVLKARDINESFKNLTDRGWGKPSEHVVINDAPATTLDLDEKSDEELDAIIERLERERASVH